VNCLNDYLEKRYTDLLEYSKQYTKHPSDLVHYVYLRLVDGPFEFIDEPKTDYYFKKTIKTHAARGFREMYEVQGPNFIEIADIQETHDIDKRICIEKLDTVVRHLDEFDRSIFELYLRGENMSKVSYESEIPLRTIYHTLNRVRKIVDENT